MTTPNNPDVQLAVRAAGWCGWPVSGLSALAPQRVIGSTEHWCLHESLVTGPEADHLLVALLAKCRLEGILYAYNYNGIDVSAHAWRTGDATLPSSEGSTDLRALLRALDAAGVLP